MEDDVHFILDFMESKVRYYSKKIDELVKEPFYGGTERIELLTRKHTIENLIDDIREIFELEEEKI